MALEFENEEGAPEDDCPGAEEPNGSGTLLLLLLLPALENGDEAPDEGCPGAVAILPG